MKVSVIIINYKTPQLTIACIKSIYENTTFDKEFEIIVVDNGSHDDSIELISREYPSLKLVDSKINLGFGKANNLAAKHAKGDFLFFINSDMIFIDDSIRKLYDFYIENESKLQLGVLGCKLEDQLGNINNSGGGFPLVNHDIREIYIAVAERFLKRSFAPRDPYDFNRAFFEIDYVIGADMFLRKQLFEQAGGFDDHYFMYYEESDLQMEIRKLGFKNYIFTGTSIIHLEGASSKSEDNGRISNFKRITLAESRNYYFKKNDRNHYTKHIIFDMILNVTRLFNRKYSIRENIEFVKQNIKSY